jgi:polyphosphate kinase 2 (PPK2 family)
MLENVNLSLSLGRQAWQRELPSLQRRLFDLEKACWDHGIPSMIIFEGWEAAGKGGAISTLTARLDARGFKLYTITPPRTHEQEYPWLWRFWLKVPNRGEMAIFDHSWYRRVLDDRVEKTVPAREWRKAYLDIAEFERMLADDGTVIVKFWFHISKKEQKKRFRKIEKDPLESWRITKEDWKRHEKYDEYLLAAEEMFERTESEYAPWTIVEATCRRWARRKVFQTIIAALERALGPAAPPVAPPNARDAELRRVAARIGGEDNGGA